MKYHHLFFKNLINKTILRSELINIINHEKTKIEVNLKQSKSF